MAYLLFFCHGFCESFSLLPASRFWSRFGCLCHVATFAFPSNWYSLHKFRIYLVIAIKKTFLKPLHGISLSQLNLLRTLFFCHHFPGGVFICDQYDIGENVDLWLLVHIYNVRFRSRFRSRVFRLQLLQGPQRQRGAAEQKSWIFLLGPRWVAFHLLTLQCIARSWSRGARLSHESGETVWLPRLTSTGHEAHIGYSIN